MNQQAKTSYPYSCHVDNDNVDICKLKNIAFINHVHFLHLSTMSK